MATIETTLFHHGVVTGLEVSPSVFSIPKQRHYGILKNRLIVCFKSPDAFYNAIQKESNLQYRRLHNINNGNHYHAPSATEQQLLNTVLITPLNDTTDDLEAAYNRFALDASVEYVMYDQYYHLLGQIQPQQEATLSAWWFEAINCRQALAPYTRSKKPVKVAIIDSGIDREHPDFEASTFDQPDNIQFGNVLTPVEARYYGRHGTHIAGIIGAANNQYYTVGIAPQSQLMDLWAFPGATEASLIQAVKYAVDNGAQVINASWGSKIDAENNPNVGQALKTVIQYAVDNGVVFVCAAGNDGIAVDHLIPAGFEQVIVVGSVERSHNGAVRKVAGSNYGPRVIWAPGVGIQSLDAEDDYQMLTMSGTSMAAAFVSGLVARMLERNPGLIHDITSQHSVNTAEAILKHIKFRPGFNGQYPDTPGLIDVDNTLQ